jgi:hypothetical protein
MALRSLIETLGNVSLSKIDLGGGNVYKYILRNCALEREVENRADWEKYIRELKGPYWTVVLSKKKKKKKKNNNNNKNKNKKISNGKTFYL